MKIFDTRDVRELDALTMAFEPVSAIDLMERASCALFDWISLYTPSDAAFAVVAGAGNNGGDALALARMLHQVGRKVRVIHMNPAGKLSEGCRMNQERFLQLQGACLQQITQDKQMEAFVPQEIIIEGLFGSGLSRPLEEPYAGVVRSINRSGNRILSIDIPSGLFGEDNRYNDPDKIVRADTTLTFQFPKTAFFFAENEPFVGDWRVLDIGIHPDAIARIESTMCYFTDQDLFSRLKKRGKFSHKGTYGHALLVAGSFGKMGAAVLSSRAVLRSGAGLLTVHVPQCGNMILQTAVPEAMLSFDGSQTHFTECPALEPYSAVGVGPGLGSTDQKSFAAFAMLLERIKSAGRPLVVDADALNMLSKKQELFSLLPSQAVLTPHPKEFDRLFGAHDCGYARFLTARKEAAARDLVVVLKGAYTVTCLSDGRVFFNSTGNPGMATAGSGDVLTGIILSLLAQGYAPRDAAPMGVLLHGRSGDMAASRLSQASLIAGDIVDALPLATAFEGIF